jgi:hypothetical protein
MAKLPCVPAAAGSGPAFGGDRSLDDLRIHAAFAGSSVYHENGRRQISLTIQARL